MMRSPCSVSFRRRALGVVLIGAASFAAVLACSEEPRVAGIPEGSGDSPSPGSGTSDSGAGGDGSGGSSGAGQGSTGEPPAAGGTDGTGAQAGSVGTPAEGGRGESGGGSGGSGGSGGEASDGQGGGAPANAGGEAGTSDGAAGNPSNVAGAGGSDAGVDEALFVPRDLAVTNLSGEGQAVNVVASTLLVGPDGPALYAALKNDGEMSACDAAVSFELFDKADQSIGAWIGGLYSEQLFRRDTGGGGLIACIDPGRTAMVALTDLPEDLAIEDVGAAVYQLTYFDRDILPFGLIAVDELRITDIVTVMRGSENAFTGTFENGLDVEVESPSVTLFALSASGRPLGIATSTSPETLPPGESWAFETTTLDDAGEGRVAFPRGTVSFSESM